MDIKIVVLDKGFVYVGYTEVKDGWVHMHDCLNIRRFGTTEGLGQLRNGPTSETVFDKVGELIAPLHALISIIDVVGTAWKSQCKV